MKSVNKHKSSFIINRTVTLFCSYIIIVAKSLAEWKNINPTNKTGTSNFQE